MPKMIDYLSTMSNTKSEANIVGTEITIPYLIKSAKVYFISCFLSKDVHIIPANAPTGVKKAPMFEPIIAPYTPLFTKDNGRFSAIELYKTLIGMLFMRLAVIKELRPYLYITLFIPKNPDISLVIPYLSKARTITNMDITKGTSCHGALFIQETRTASFFF